MRRLSILVFMFSLFTSTAHAQKAFTPVKNGPSTDTYAGAMIGFSTAGDGTGWLGGEFGMKNFNVNLLLHPGDLFYTTIAGSYFYDMFLAPKMFLTALGGPFIGYTSYDVGVTGASSSFSSMVFGIDIGARFTYMLNKKLGIFATTIFQIPMFYYTSWESESMGYKMSDSETDFDLDLEIAFLIGANYRF